MKIICKLYDKVFKSPAQRGEPVLRNILHKMKIVCTLYDKVFKSPAQRGEPVLYWVKIIPPLNELLYESLTETQA